DPTIDRPRRVRGRSTGLRLRQLFPERLSIILMAAFVRTWEWSTHRMLETDVRIALARRRDKRSADRRTLERLVDRAIARCDLDSVDLPSTHAGKAEAVDEITDGAFLYGSGGLFIPP